MTVVSRDEMHRLLEAGHETLTAALVDLADLGEINRDSGAEVGDRIIEAVPSLLSQALPQGSVVTRMGGDEFACLLPGIRSEEALLLLQPLTNLRGPPLPKGLNLGTAIGIANYPDHAHDPHLLLEAADEALHRAKKDERHRIAIFVEQKMVLKSSYYPPAHLARLAALARRLGQTEASLLRQALVDLLDRHRDGKG